MPARTAREAVGEFADGLTRLANIVSGRPLLATGHSVGPSHYVSFLPHRQPVPLRRQDVSGAIGFDLRIDYVVLATPTGASRFDVEVIGYSYRLLERSGREILVFHWHPEGVSDVTHPHLHITSRLRPIPIEPVGEMVALAEHHVPTGHVSLAAVVRYLIVEVGVEPRRPDWIDILAANDV